ncbi:NmrA family NAD(P)-binding protein [Saccharomonospora sp. NPDC006951]
MKIVVIGGTGLIGSKVVSLLGGQGHETVAASPATGVNTITGEGVADALRGADVVVDVSNSPSFADADVLAFFRTSTRTLIDAATGAGVRHYVALTVVGTRRLAESGYFRAKVEQENLIAASGLPYSLVHATQFFEFAGGIAEGGARDGTIHLSGASVRPVAAADVAATVAAVAAGPPRGGALEVAGPEVLGLDEWIRAVLVARGDTREVVTDPEAGYFGARLRQDSLLPGPGAEIVPTRLADWLAAEQR